MKNLQTFEQFVNESTTNEAIKFNPRDLDAGTFFDYIDSMDDETIEEYEVDMDKMTKGYELIAKALGGNLKNVNFGDSENNNYEFFKFLMNVTMGTSAFDKGAKVPEVKILKTFNVPSGWRDGDYGQAQLVEIPGVCKYVTWLDGDDFSNFDYAAYKSSDVAKIAKWAQENYLD
jgi:hypothetical protein